MTDPISAIAAISQSIGIVKSLREMSKDFDKATYKLQIADLTESLANAKLSMSEVQDQIAAKNAEIARLKETLQRGAKMIDLDGFSYDQQEDGKPVGKPYCPRCHKMDGVLMRLVNANGGLGDFQCPQCKQKYYDVTEYISSDQF